MQTKLNRQTQKLNERDGLLAQREQTQMQKQQAMSAGIEILLYLTLKENVHKYSTRGYISIQDLNDMEETYNAYHAMGGNGVGTKIFEDLKHLPNLPPAAH